MDDKQKVYIRVQKERNKEIDLIFEQLGYKDVNSRHIIEEYSRLYSYDREDVELIIYPHPNGELVCTALTSFLGDLVVDNYHEIKLPESPKGGVKMKQRIQFTGKNLNEIFALPCVCAIKKTTKDKPVIELLEYDDDDYKREYAAAMDKWKDWKHSDEEMYVDMRAFNSKYPKLVYIGDWLVEQDNGGWRVEKGGTE